MYGDEKLLDEKAERGYDRDYGKVAERFKAAVLKTAVS
jgi:hypothetical protein